MEKYSLVGVMSGTSLDGLDLALCHFTNNNVKWKYSIAKATTKPYSKEWTSKLTNASLLPALEFIKLHKEYGKYIGQSIRMFLSDEHETAMYISSHGHTIFHNPKENLTFQLGDGSCIAAQSGITTISDFRNLDVALGGQGAPLVPLGDELLFGEYGICLNLGGFSNISYNENKIRKAFDICPVNIVLNYLANKEGLPYDKDGTLGAKGTIIPSMLKNLNHLSFYAMKGSRSLGREWVEEVILPIIEKKEYLTKDILRTVYEHIAEQIAAMMPNSNPGYILATGGGALNTYLIQLLNDRLEGRLIVPDKLIVEYKEALIFAFLGLRRIRNENNCLCSVTGANHDNCGGIIWKAPF
jgi:anhydro-N-acetylmuramic acid kinase